jgi:hypothetical protein
MSSELDLQNAIAKREARELAHRQAAANFYRESSTKIHPLSRHQQLIPPCDYDEHLMLYRDPPPWNNLETTHTDPTTIKSESQRLATNVALPNRGSAKGTEGVKALAEMIKRRKDVQNASCPSQADGGVPNSGKSKGESRNPFRRKGDPVAHSLVTEPGTQKALLTKSVLSLENKTYANVTKPSKRMAAVKPSESFSSLQMPASPEEYQQTAKKLPDQQVPNRGERTDNTGSLLTCLSGSGPPEQVGKIRISAEALSSSTARKTKGDAENSGVFDWKKWCNM